MRRERREGSEKEKEVRDERKEMKGKDDGHDIYLLSRRRWRKRRQWR